MTARELIKIILDNNLELDVPIVVNCNDLNGQMERVESIHLDASFGKIVLLLED